MFSWQKNPLTLQKRTKKNYITNNTNGYHIDDTCSMDLLDLNGYGPNRTKFTEKTQ